MSHTRTTPSLAEFPLASYEGGGYTINKGDRRVVLDRNQVYLLRPATNLYVDNRGTEIALGAANSMLWVETEFEQALEHIRSAPYRLRLSWEIRIEGRQPLALDPRRVVYIVDRQYCPWLAMADNRPALEVPLIPYETLVMEWHKAVDDEHQIHVTHWPPRENV